MLQIMLQIAVGILNFFIWQAAWAEASNLEQMAQRLAELRAQVDRLQQELDQAKDAQRLKLEALGTQLAQLEAEKRRQELVLQKLQSQWQNLSQKRPATSNDAGLSEVLRQGMTALRHYLETSLPFKRSERLQALSELETKLQTGTAAPEKLAQELWALVEDELHLTRENGLYRQTLPIEGETALVEVAKLGMVMLFFKTPDGRYGLVRRREGNWSYELVSQSNDQDLIAALMESLRKQIR